MICVENVIKHLGFNSFKNVLFYVKLFLTKSLVKKTYFFQRLKEKV